jgi:nucleobase:cation symporter-1, NCS1 family
VLGFDVIMRLQAFIVVATVVLTLGYIALTLDEISWSAVTEVESGSTQAFIGALLLAATALGVGWTNTAADYSRYLPRNASGAGVVGWTTFGGAIAPLILIVFGVMLVASNGDLVDAIGSDPVGALTTLLPTWYLVPFAIVAVLGLIGGAVLDIYSSGLALLTLGLRIPRYAAAALDGVIMVLGAIYVVFVADDFITPFQGFLITIGVPIAAWAGVMIADIALRKAEYADRELYDPRGRYGDIRVESVALMVIGTVLGWGLVTNGLADWLTWQGYLLEPFGLGGKEGEWAFANLGVAVALLVGFLGWLVLGRSHVRRQESRSA